jgi:hypothetical protein
MTVPTADMAELVSMLRAIDSVEALDAAWPAIARSKGKLAKIAARRKKTVFYQSMPVRDDRDGSWIRSDPEMRAPRPYAWQELDEEVTEILRRPVFHDPRAQEKRGRLQDFAVKMISN